MSNESSTNGQIKLDTSLDLAKDFPSPTYEEWKASASESLKGAPFEKKLVTPTYEGIDLQPIYTENDIENLPHLDQKPGFDGFVRGTHSGGYLENHWEVCQEIPAASTDQFNKALLNELERGLTAVNLTPDTASRMGMDSDSSEREAHGKVAISTLDDLSTALNGIDVEKFPVHIDAGVSGLGFISMLNAYCKKQNKNMANVKGSIDTDPLAILVSEGILPFPIETLMDHMSKVTSWASENASSLKTIGVSGLPYHNAGCDAVRELAYVLATAVEYTNALIQRDLSLDAIFSAMRFTFGIGPFYFMEVAKIRAARILWSRIVEAYGDSEAAKKLTIHGRTSTYNQTVYDPYVNMLRTTTETFSALVGGVDSLHANMFNEVYGIGDEFSRRVARNTQVVLDEECHLAQVIDPAGGSYFVEKLTHDVAEKAWKLFQEIESKGGMFQALKEGFPQAETEAVDKKRKADIAKRKSMIVGTNFSANVKEKKLEITFPDKETALKTRSEYLKKYRDMRDASAGEIKLKLQELANGFSCCCCCSCDVVTKSTEAILSGATLGEIFAVSGSGNPETVKQLKETRATVMFEELRDAVEAYKEKTGSAPKLFLATMGPLSQYKPRADFSQSFFEIGGFEIIYPQGFNPPAEAVKAAVESGALVTVICSTDETYPELVSPITSGIKAQKPSMPVVLAGFPKDQVEAHKQAGVDEFIYLGVDAYQVLSGLLKTLGVLS